MNSRIWIFVHALCLLSTSCSDDEKVWVTQEVVNTYPDGSKFCYCTEADFFDDSDVTYGYERASEAVEYYFWKGRKCEELGYVKTGDSFNGPNNGTAPGPNGYFGSAASANCDQPYQSPTADVQLDALCETAYLYRCSGNASAADFTCQQYATLASTTSNAPDCPYCQ